MWCVGLPQIERGGVELGVREASAAPAAEHRVAVLPLHVKGEMPDTDRDELTKALLSGLERGKFEVVGPDEVTAADASASGCTDAGCAKQIATATSAQYVVRSTVTIQDRDYTIVVELLDGATGEPVAQTEDGCEICGVADVSGMFSTGAATLGTKIEALATGPGIFSLTSEPAGALVTLDGEIIGATPLERPTVAGKHVLRVSAEGFIAIEREVTFVEGVSEELNIKLEPLPSKLPSRPWGWVSLGFGVAALGGGVFLTWLHDQPYKVGENCTGADVITIDGMEQCKFLHDTKWAGAGVLVAGAALTTLGVVILVNSAQKTKKDKGKKTARLRRPRFGVGPGSVMIQGRF
ncbi:MAG: PEGA domain-containing protein [Myxococcales bacterium]|nr:PEGA domain-containing protein [Myxococcales bacterium]MCB9750062.1 PEGA domain-containing protein [Myxococcales bacterium]